MPGARNEDQKVDAFSAPKDLLRAAGVEALRRGMSKSGFYRYCLAKECGHSEEEALSYAEHGSVLRSRENLQRAVYPPHQEEVSVIEDKAFDAALKDQELIGAATLAGKEGAAMLGLKPRAASTTGKKAAPARPVPRASSAQQSPPKPVPTSRGS